MITDNDLTISWLENKYGATIGTPLHPIHVLDDFSTKIPTMAGNNKKWNPVLFPHQGFRSQYSPSNVFFIDFDSDFLTEHFEQNLEEVFKKVPMILFYQRSISDKIHLICALDSKKETETEWCEAATYYTIAVCIALQRVLHLEKNANFLSLYASKKGELDYAIDKRSLSPFQPFYVCKNPLYRNPYGRFANQLSPENMKLIQESEYYDCLIPKCVKVKQYIKDTQIIDGDMKWYGNVDELDMTGFTLRNGISPRELHSGDITNEYGHIIRLQVRNALTVMLGEKYARTFANKYFLNLGDGEFKKYPPNLIVLNWLLSNYFTPDRKNKYEIKTTLGEDYGDLIREEMKECPRLLIDAPTGTGKTYLINTIASEHNLCLTTPYKSLRDYPDLYCGFSRYDKVDKAQGFPLPDGSFCAIWDTIADSDLNDWTLVFDESHLLFHERDYRQTARQMFNKIKDEQKRFIGLTATPTMEAQLLNCKVLSFWNSRQPIPLNFALSVQPNEYINELMNEYTKDESVVVFTDRGIDKLHSNNPQALYIRKETVGKKDSEVASYFCRKQVPIGRATLCSKIVNTGLNIENTNPIHAVVTVYEGEDDWTKVVQAVGRFRRAESIRITVVYVPRLDQDADREQEHTDELIKRELDVSGVEADENICAEDWLPAIKEIDEYTTSHSNPYQLLIDLHRVGYFNISIEHFKYDRRKQRLTKTEEKASRECFKNWLNGGNDEQETNERIQIWKEKYDKYSLAGFDWKDFILMRTNKNIDDLFVDIGLRMKATEFGTKNELEQAYDYKILEKLYGHRGSQKLYNQYLGLFRKIREYWTLWEKCDKDIHKYVSVTTEQQKKAIEEGRKAMSDGGSKGIFVDVYCIGELKGKHLTKKEACELIGCNARTLNNIIAMKPRRKFLEWEVRLSQMQGMDEESQTQHVTPILF